MLFSNEIIIPRRIEVSNIAFDNFKLFLEWAEDYFTPCKNVFVGPGGRIRIDYFKDTIPVVLDMEYFTFSMFYNLYSSRFSKPYLCAAARNLSNPTHREWIEYCIDATNEWSEDQKEIFLDGLEFWCTTLGLPFPKYKMVLTAEPFPITLELMNELALKNLENYSYVKYFSIMLLILRDISCWDNTINIDGCDCESDEDIIDRQRRIIHSLTSQTDKINKPKARLFLLWVFDYLNSLKHFTKKFPIPANFHSSSYKFQKRGFFLLPWDKVKFYDGYYTIPHPNYPLFGKQPLTIHDLSSRKVFNDIKEIFFRTLPPIPVESVDGYIVRVVSPSVLSQSISLLERKVLCASKAEQKTAINPDKGGRKMLTKQEALPLVKQHKSRFLDFLCKQHLIDYQVVCCIENRINSNMVVTPENAFIFTIKEDRAIVYLAYENVSDSRCTYVFPVSKSRWQEAINRIFDFFSSNNVNKRYSMSKDNVDLRLPGNYAQIRILHSDYNKWVDRIKYCR